MKVVHLITRREGGAYIAARRIVEAEVKAGIDASLLAAVDLGVDPRMSGFSLRNLPFRLARKTEQLLMCLSSSTNPVIRTCGLRTIGLLDRINALDADVLHLHWIGDGMLSVGDIARLRQPLVWTLHDSWAFCGTEHHPNICEGDRRYRDGYLPENFPASSRGLDVDRLVWRRKMRLWENRRIDFAAPSRWMAELFESSVLGRGRKCSLIPNCVPQSVFTPGNRIQARRNLGLPTDGKIVLFGAVAVDDPNKGSRLLVEAIRLLQLQRTDITLACFGRQQGVFPIPCRAFGSIGDERLLAELYRAADVFVCPSFVETLSNTCIEAAACGTPSVSFQAAGQTDAIDPFVTGYQATPYEARDLAAGVAYCLDNPTTFPEKCRQFAEARFSERRTARLYGELYEGVCHRVR